MEFPNKNTGVLIRDLDATDYIAGASPLVIKEINLSGDNRVYRPDEEHQSGSGGDKMDCVTVSSAGCIETVIHILMANKMLSQAHLDWLKKWKFIGPDGKVRLSTRWAAIQNGTTSEGNYAQDVAYWWRHNGFIPEWILPNDQSMNWEQFYDNSCLTDEMRKCAKESKDLFKVTYEWVFGDDKKLRENLKRGSVQILTAVCAGWRKGDKTPVPFCDQQVQHATELLFVDSDGFKIIWDSYDPHSKSLSADYSVPYRILYMVEPKKIITKNTMITVKEQGKPAIYLLAGNKLVPFATTWEDYRVEFPDAQIIELPVAEFAKMSKTSLKITK